jgi:osmotically inducible protein OsmC
MGMPCDLRRFSVAMSVLYTAVAHATGDGRNGHVTSDDGLLDVDVRMPPELGGAGGATNPEQLFAAGYAACFHSALKVVGRMAGADLEGTTVSASVGIGPNTAGGFELAVELDVEIPNVERAAAEQLVEQAHQVCPYSNATRGNIPVTLSIV